MRIVTKEFHDYYDNCMAYGLDKSIVYDRKMTELFDDDELTKESKKLFVNIPSRSYSKQNVINETINEYNSNQIRYAFDSGIIGFCGIIHPFLTVRYAKHDAYGWEESDDYIYDFESYEKFIKKIKTNENNFILHNMKAMEKYFNCFEETDFFFKIKNPIFLNIEGCRYRERKLIINPCLKKYKFYKVIDSMTAFQQISMFLSGVLGEVHPPTIEVSNEVKKHKAGFGHKYAFKKEPSKKKNKRK